MTVSTPANHIWKPSSARLVTLDCFIPVARGCTSLVSKPLSWPAKDPNDILDYVIDISPLIVGNDGDTIEYLDVTVTPANPGDLVLQSSTTDGSRIVLWLAAGEAGTVYTVTLALSMASGRVLERSVLLPVIMLSTPAVPQNAIVIETLGMLTDQNGNPVVSV